MKETYGILGTGVSSKKVIQAALDDIGTKPVFIVPWYGKVTEGLETVYDWLLDNEATFNIVHGEGKNIPKALAAAAADIFQTRRAVDDYIIDSLMYGDLKGLATILWDEEDDRTSHRLAEKCIDKGLPTLELTNGLVPIIISPSDEDKVVNTSEEDDTEDFDKETLEQMPEAVVKRVAKNKGLKAASKEEAIKKLSSEETADTQKTIVRVTIEYSDGTTATL